MCQRRPGNESEPWYPALMDDIESRVDEESAQSEGRQRANRLAGDGRQPVHRSITHVGDRRNRGNQQLTAWAKDRSEAIDDESLISVPVEGLRAHDDVDRSPPQRQGMSIGSEQAGTSSDTSCGLGEHARRVVDTDHLRVGKALDQPSGQLPRATAQVEDRPRAHVDEAGHHGVVNGPVRGVLKAGAVVHGRPSVEQA